MNDGTSTSPSQARVRASSTLRSCAAVLLTATAAIHIPLIPQHIDEAPYIGWSFVGLVATCSVLAVSILLRDSRAVWLASAVVSGGALVAYVLSRSVGLPQIGDDVGDWLNPLGVAALATESATVVLALWTLILRPDPRESSAQEPGQSMTRLGERMAG